MPSPVAGVLQKIIVAVDSTVAVGAELAVIADGAAATSAPAAPVVAAPVTPPPAPVVAAPVTPPPAPVVAAPAAVASSTGTIVTMPEPMVWPPLKAPCFP
ncbi:MAG: hypothetical protein ACKOW2_07660 [Sphingobacteriaceae bacterium]